MITQHNFIADIDNLDVLGEMIRLKPTETFEGGTVLLLRNTFGPPVHRHPHQDELIQVKQGKLEVLKGRKWITVKAGEKVLIKKNTPHTYRNSTCQDVVFDFAVTPKTGLIFLLLTLDELVKAGKITGTKNIRSIVHFNQALVAYPQVTQSVNPPQWLVKLLAHFGKLFGLSIEKEKFRSEYLRSVKTWKGENVTPGDIPEEVLEQALF